MVKQTGISPSEGLDLYRKMIRIRYFEEELRQLFKSGELPGFVHLYSGEEAIAVGACSVLEETDYITSTHRGHGHLIAKGADPDRMMAELFGRVDGYCKGMGGSMHIVDFELGILGANGIVGAGVPIATGAGLSAKMRQSREVIIAFFGDGATNIGTFTESMNLCSVWDLPVIFLCENNLYTEWMRSTSISAGTIEARGTAYGLTTATIDGNDVLAVRDAVHKAVGQARNGEGPSLIVANTYRHFGHVEGEEVFSGKYRPDDEVALWRDRDPIQRFRGSLLSDGVAAADLEAIDAAESGLIAAAVEFGKASPIPDAAAALEGLFSEGEEARP